MELLDNSKLHKVEMKELMNRVNMVKLEGERQNMEMAASFVTWTAKEIVNEIEDILDGEKQVKHINIQKKIEGFLEKDVLIKQFTSKNPRADPAFLEYFLPILIQSGKNINVTKFNIQSDENKLNSETVYFNVCGKYKDMNAMASRTLIVNPSEA
mmetsp:Transcript_39635/g.38175  ORF Transcript_39635/g.38175 Transcript_39635/m.38175 type:complete len:155 (+) Transcript_39635:450-914(+)